MTGALSPLSHGQQRLLLSELRSPGTTDSYMVHAFPLSRPLDEGAFVTAVRDVLGRHPVLRTTYGWDDVFAPGQRVGEPDAVVPEVVAGPSAGSLAAIAGQVTTDWWDRPFDLEVSPIRVRVVPQAGRSVVCLALHHIACDGWSARIVGRDLRAAYATRCQGGAPRWEPAADYRDYARWERGQVAPWAAQDVPFWRQRVGEAVPEPRFAPVTGETARVDHAVPVGADTVDGLLRLPRRERLVLLLGLVAELLTTGRQPAITLGTVTSGRFNPEFRTGVGCYVNLMPVPVPVQQGESRPDRLARLGRLLPEYLRHARTPYDELVRQVGPAAGFDVTVSLNDWSASGGAERPPVSPLVLPAPRTSSGLHLEATLEADRTMLVRGRWPSGLMTGSDGPRLVERLTGALAEVVA